MAESLRVALDVSAVPETPYGAGQYTVELARALAGRDDVDLAMISRRSDGARWEHLAGARVAAVAPDSRALRLVYGEILLGRLLGGACGGSPEVFHGPHYSLPAPLRVPGVVTVHDLTLVEHPEWHEPLKVAYFARALRRAARRAAAVVCPSALTAGRFSERYHPSGTVHVVPHGVDHGRFAPEPDGGAASDDAALTRLGLGAGGTRPAAGGARFVLHLGTLEPRKDVVSLVAAFDAIAGRHPELLLVLAGREGWGLGPLDDAIASARHATRIRRLGYVGGDEVAALLRRAAVVAYPSLEEGFGLPALEALACAAPLVTTEGTVMAELAGGAALLVPRQEPRVLAEALEAVLAGGPGVESRRRQGLAVAALRTWEASAAGHLVAYRAAAGR